MLRALPASFLFLSLLVPPALAKPATVAPAAPPLLPTDFAGWSLSGPAQESAAPEAADAANASVLKEFGFQQFSAAHYANADNKLSVRAIRFQDASGAFGAFTFFVVITDAARVGLSALPAKFSSHFFLSRKSALDRVAYDGVGDSDSSHSLSCRVRLAESKDRSARTFPSICLHS